MSLEPSLRTIFSEALEHEDLAERSRYLDAACATDAPLRARVEKLLRAHFAAGKFLSDLDNSGNVTDEKPGQIIGRYKLLQEIGEGGCGIVYMAEQEEPVRRRVALKIIKLGMDTRSVIARFEAERQALAMMDHPNIATVLDAGATGTGRPYFVMELVRGIKITEYCDQNQLNTKERLQLFIQVCKAIQHAHSKGIIHRDLKPGNILVTFHDGVAVPKIIDFGIAKATGQERLTDKTLFTAFEQFVGTPAYMSPEQAEMSGLDIDTRSDIYSLGVLLYELLTGETPFDGRELLAAGLDQMLRTIRAKEPRLPSTRLAAMVESALTSTARNRRTDAPKLVRLLKGDLDWIVMKCLEKDRTRRYATAIEPAFEIERYLKNEPVVARPPTRIYQFQKLFHRNKVAFASAAAVLAALVGGISVSTWLYFRERQAVVIAEQNEQRANRNAEESYRTMYAADMILAQTALQSGNIARAQELLRKYLPMAGKKDVRNWEWRYAWEQCRSDALFSLNGHSSTVTTLALSPTGQLLASGSEDNKVNIWDLRSQTLLRTLTQDRAVRGLAFSTDGKELIVGCKTVGVQFYETEGWRPTAILSNLSVRGLIVSPNGRIMAIRGAMFLTVWDLPSRTKIFSSKVFNSSNPVLTHYGHDLIAGLAFAPNSELLAYSDGNGGIVLWNAINQKTIVELKSHKGPVQTLAFSPDGSLLVSGGYDRTVRIWNVQSGQELKVIDAFPGFVASVALSPAGDILAVAGADQRIRLFETQAWEEIPAKKGHLDEVWSVVFTGDGTTAFSAGKDTTIKSWPVAKRPTTNLMRRPPHVRSLSWQAGARRLYVLHTNDVYSVWDINPLKEVGRYPFPPFPLQGYTASTISTPDGRFWIGATNGVVRIFDHVKNRLLDVSTSPGALITRLIFSRDGQILAGTANDNTCRLWRFPTLQNLTTFPIDAKRLPYPEFSRDNRLLGIGHANGVDIWNVISNEKVGTVQTGGDYVVNLSISLDETKVATAGSDGKVHLWNIATGQKITTFGSQLGNYYTVGFSPDDQRLFACGADGKVTFWDTATYQEVASLKLGEHDLEGADFLDDPDESLFVIGTDRFHLLRAPSGNAR